MDFFRSNIIWRIVDLIIGGVFIYAGAIKALEKAKKDGNVRFLGFSAHSVEAALAPTDRFSFDSIKFVTAPMPLTRT